MSWNLMIVILGIVSAMYALPYGIWEWQHKNKSGGILVYTVALLGTTLSILQYFF